MRKPVAQGRFSSAFGMRRHPILRRYRMHSGVDWAAPSGTPIMAAGNGVVEKIGTRAGYGRSITLRHTNGYETTYNHMSGYAQGPRRPATASRRARSSAMSARPASPPARTSTSRCWSTTASSTRMKIRVPRGRELQGAELVAFEQERQRIDELLARDDSPVASAE